jgi:hypothetical protein
MAHGALRAALLLRLRLPLCPVPQGVLPQDHKCTKCGEVLDVYGDHAQSCKSKATSGMASLRHDRVRDVIATAAKKDKGSMVIVEPVLTQLGLVPKPEHEHTVYRADVAIAPRDHVGNVAPPQAQLVDVIVTTALANSTKHQLEMGVTTRDNDGKIVQGAGRPAGAAAEVAHKFKLDVYNKRFSDLRPGNVVPFAIEAHGFLHKRALELVKSLAGRRPKDGAAAKAGSGSHFFFPKDYSQNVRRLLERIALTQQVGNFFVVAKFAQECLSAKARAAAGMAYFPAG